MLAYRHIKWGLISELSMRAFSWHSWISGTLKLYSILSLCKCVNSTISYKANFVSLVAAATALTLTFLVLNFDEDDPRLRADLDKAKTWERGFVDFMRNYTQGQSVPAKPVWMDVAYNSERSIEDELDRTSRCAHEQIHSSFLIRTFLIREPQCS